MDFWTLCRDLEAICSRRLCGTLEFLRVEEFLLRVSVGAKSQRVSLPNTFVLPANAFKLRWFYSFFSIIN
jgi:hypothetical protein